MTITLNLTKEQELLLEKQAQETGIDAEAWLRIVVESALNDRMTIPATPRVLGLHAGSVIYIADDFDDELPESFWLGEQ